MTDQIIAPPMHPEKEATVMTEYRIAISVTARFSISGKLYPETFRWHGRLYTIEKIRKVSYFSGDTYGTQDRVFLVKYGGALFHLFYIGGRWYVELKNSEPVRSRGCSGNVSGRKGSAGAAMMECRK